MRTTTVHSLVYGRARSGGYDESVSLCRLVYGRTRPLGDDEPDSTEGQYGTGGRQDVDTLDTLEGRCALNTSEGHRAL